MPFDFIMGVGRSPQITKDVIVNPYSITSEIDIASAGKLSFISNYVNTTTTGDINLLVNENNDGNTSVFQVNNPIASTATAEIILDIEKSIYWKKALFSCDVTQAAGTSAPYSIVLEIMESEDGNNFQTKSSATYTTSSITKKEITAYYMKGRYLKFKITSDYGFTANFYILKAFNDNLQY